MYLFRLPAVRRVLVKRMMGTTELWGKINEADLFFVDLSRSVSYHSCVSEVLRQFFWHYDSPFCSGTYHKLILKSIYYHADGLWWRCRNISTSEAEQMKLPAPECLTWVEQQRVLILIHMIFQLLLFSNFAKKFWVWVPHLILTLETTRNCDNLRVWSIYIYLASHLM